MAETHERAARLPRALVNEVLHHAQVSPDREICGLIAARDGEPDKVYPIANASARPARFFDMEAHALIEAMRAMRARGEELFAIYHSHPSSTAMPSPEDLQDTGYPDALYLIVALGTKGVLELRGFHVENGAAEEVGLEIF